MDANYFNWNIFEVSGIFSPFPAFICSHEKEQQELLQWHYSSLSEDQSQENMLFSEYSDRKTTLMKTDRQPTRNSSKGSIISSPASETRDSSSKKTSATYIVGKLNKILLEHVLNIFTGKTMSKSRSSMCFPSSTEESH
jgi:hypothetical protein